MAPEHHLPLLGLLAATGLRISEAIGLQRLHLQLDQSEPEVCIRRAIVRDRIVPPKSKYGNREVRLPEPLTAKLRAHLAAQPDQDSTALAFPSEAGGPLDPNNLRRRILKPLAEEVDAPWAGLPHVPPHLRLAPSQPRHQPPPAKPRPRPPLARLHADPLHPSVARRWRPGARCLR